MNEPNLNANRLFDSALIKIQFILKNASLEHGYKPDEATDISNGCNQDVTNLLQAYINALSERKQCRK